MKAIQVLLVTIFIAALFSGCSTRSQAEEPEKAFPLSIEALRKREFPQGKLTIEKQDAKTAEYSAAIISYVSEGFKLYAMMYTPSGKAAGEKIPTIIVNHGYIPPNRYSTVTSYRDVSTYYASNGFLVFKPDYRGHAGSEGSASSPFNSANYSIDVLNLIEAVKNYPVADLENLFMYGHSMGGEITLRVLEVSDAVKAATLWAPVSAPFPENTLYFIRRGNAEQADRFIKEVEASIEKADYDSLSPLYYTRYIKVPILIQHGTKDESVPYEWTLRLNAELDKSRVSYTFYTYEGENHNLNLRSYQTVKKRDVEFFSRIAGSFDAR